jgi:hypothetical protein
MKTSVSSALISKRHLRRLEKNDFIKMKTNTCINSSIGDKKQFDQKIDNTVPVDSTTIDANTSNEQCAKGNVPKAESLLLIYFQNY